MTLEETLAIIYAEEQKIKRQNDEIIYANVFHDTIKGSSWLPKDFPFSPGRGALGYPALYILYRILNEINPKKILETGLGQSTKMISFYNQSCTDCKHWIVEHDPSWIDFFSHHFNLPESTQMIQLDIVDFPLELENGRTSNCTAYCGFANALEGQKYDFICIDGPYGYRSPDYSRIDIMGILPECLNESFVIMIDDTERNGESNTVKLIVNTLRESGIDCNYYTYSGMKDTTLIFSLDHSFLTGL